MAPAVRLREAVALAGRFPLLAGVSLDVDEGEIVHVQGPNGAGKSSLLRLCCGLVPLSSGEGVVLGHDLSRDRRSLRREVGLLGHASFLYDELSVEENLSFALRAGRLGARAASARASEAIVRLGLTRRAGLRVSKLSAGQRRRASIAVLYARRPALWLLDEPHAGLDEEARLLLDELVGEARAEGATVMLVSHELERARGISDRVLSMAGGRTAAPGMPPWPPSMSDPGDGPAPAAVPAEAAGGRLAKEVVHVA